MKRSLENPVNAGFLRPNAKLAVIVIADEDDCSLAHKSLFEGTGDGTAVNFRCTQSGVTCDGDPNLTIPGEHANCRPKEPSPYLDDVQTYVDYLRGLKANPDKDVIVAGILGNPNKFVITTDKLLGPACTYGNQSAFPAIRTAAFLGHFPQSMQASICGADLQQPLVDIAALLKSSLQDFCFKSKVIDFDPNADGIQADCSVTEMRGDQEQGVIPSCTRGGVPCWRIEIDETTCGYYPSHQKLVIDRGGAVPSSDTRLKVNCVTEPDSGQVQ